MSPEVFKQLIKSGGSQRDFAQKIGYTEKQVSVLCNGHATITKAVGILAKHYSEGLL